MKQTTLQLLLLVAVSATVFFTNLGEAKLWDRDEPRNAGCAAEMLARSDWVVPTFNDELRHQKPVLLYWLIMSAYSVFGQNEFAARFWSALLALGTVLATYGIGRRLVNPTTGFLAGIVLSTSFMFDIAARAATPDSVLVFCGTVAIFIYVWGVFVPAKAGENSPQLRVADKWFPQNFQVVVAMYALMGLGVLAKGPVGFVIPMAIIGMFMLIQQLPEPDSLPSNRLLRIIVNILAPFRPLHFGKTLWSMRPLTAAVVILLIAAPWYLLVDARTQGDFTRLFFVGEHFGRATTAMENHGGGLWYYPLAILIGFFPWSVFWVPVALWCMRRRPDGKRMAFAEVFAVCWIAVQVGVFSIAQTKLPSYVTPCYPALAILTASCLIDWSNRQDSISNKWFLAAYGALAFSGVAVAVGLGFAAYTYFPGHYWLVAIGLIPVIGAGLAVWRLMLDERQQSLIAIFLTSILFCVLLFGFGTVAVDSAQRSQVVLNHVAVADDHQIVASYRGLESSWVFYAQKPIYECFSQTENQQVESLSRSKWWGRKPRVSPETISRLHSSAMFITTDEYVGELKSKLPNDYQVIESTDYFLKDKKILLLGRNQQRVANQSVDRSVRSKLNR